MSTATYTVDTVGWREKGTDKPFTKTDDIDTTSSQIRLKPTDKPEALATTVEAVLIVNDEEAIDEVAKHQRSDNALEWKLGLAQAEDLPPLSLELSPGVSKPQGRIELLARLVQDEQVAKLRKS